jgi:acetolactate synthase-1/2/3 large subunit
MYRVKSYSKPVILLGHGARGAKLERLLGLGIPVLTSWQAKDLVDNHHENYFGCPGIYGNRVANKILFKSEAILAIGNRMAIWNVGHEAPKQDIYMVDVDEREVRKFPHAKWIPGDAKDFVDSFYWKPSPSWMLECRDWAVKYPWLEFPTHADVDGYINAYRFTSGLQKYLKPNQIIVTDMGTSLITAHQVLRLKPQQRIMTSGGLGEMGCALPAAIGASFATNKGEVLCLHCDGGMMLNLQELQTIVHHKLPIKIIVYRNEGYLMIRRTQKVAGLKESGVAPDSGVSFPNYRHVALAFGITAGEIRTWEDYQRLIPAMLNSGGACLLEYYMNPRQTLVPKLEYEMVDGKQVYVTFDQMSPHA